MIQAKKLDTLYDKRIDCHSIVISLEVNDYLNLVTTAYSNRGGIDGQREKLRTTSAIRIRRRMVQDLVQGAVIPAVVIGIVLPSRDFGKIKNFTRSEFMALLKSVDADRISIIDGMQRTTALQEALAQNSALKTTEMRVEFWISKATNSLIYRMLVLNTGQVPWNLRNQVEVVFRSLIMEIQASVPALEVLSDGARRSAGGQFQANELVELFLVFGARKEKIDIRERLADEFTRLDFIDAAAGKQFTHHFTTALGLLVQLDRVFDRYKIPKKARESKTETRDRFVNGRDLFASQPACVGFMTAMATEIAGRPGVERTVQEQEARIAKVLRNINKMITKLNKMRDEGLADYLGFQTLNEALLRSRSSMSVGDMEREFFLRAFQVLIDENTGLADLTPCWRAY